MLKFRNGSRGLAMALFTATQQENGSWRLFNATTGEPIARVWSTNHVNRILRDSAFAEAVVAALALAGAARRQAARAAYADWLTAGGHAVDFSNLTVSRNNDAGEEDDPESPNRHLYIAGNDLGYFHGGLTGILGALARFGRIVNLAEESFQADQLTGTAARNAALDALLDRFRDGGGLN